MPFDELDAEPGRVRWLAGIMENRFMSVSNRNFQSVCSQNRVPFETFKIEIHHSEEELVLQSKAKLATSEKSVSIAN